ncbi:ras association domain-containing protein 10-like [Etheostoma cragini]|uniref:ras association domain-containing protein 10-like n=1 Tax=Etheostoma cragini TaxID=417921 RepID=UPI00155DE6EE|nr:ras association domain-containing protein 10-like [Etheostoma cragini]
MEPEEGKISVWVCREEKLVSRLTKRTTCADVVKVLLEDQNLQQGTSAAMLSGSPQSYCMVEKWRGFERILPNKTKILRLWSAWGDEQENIRFVLVKNEALLHNNRPRRAEARVVQSRESGGPSGVLMGTARTCLTLAATAAAANMSQEKQRRIVMKAFRKLDKINRKKGHAVSKDKGAVEKTETLVHLVISQDHTIRQQIHRIKELDEEIERYEVKVHLDRIKRHGVNYVQDIYMVGCFSEAPAPTDCKLKAERQDAPCTAEVVVLFEEYVRWCEEVVRLQEELTVREALVESITGEIQEQLNLQWIKRQREDRVAEVAKDTYCVMEEMRVALSAAPAEQDVESLSENEFGLDTVMIKTQLDTSLYIGLRLKSDLDAIRGDLGLSLKLWETRESELLDLLAKVETMEIEQVNNKLTDDGKSKLVAVSAEAEPVSAEKSSVWVEQSRGLSKVCNTNDEDSDTGLSSMHSQDSDNPPVCESLV